MDNGSSHVCVIRSDGGRRLVALTLMLLGAGACADPTDPDPGQSPTITTEALEDGAVGVAYLDELEATGGVSPYTWDLGAGTLPAGLALNPSTGEIVGTPTVAGTSSFTARVAGDDGLMSTKSMSVTVGPQPLEIFFAEHHDAVVGVPYEVSLEATGGDGSYSWSIATGSLPPGLHLSGDVIAGQPTERGYFSLGIRVESDGRAAVLEDRIRVYQTQDLRFFLEGLTDWIASSIEYNEDLLSRSPHLATEIQAKTDLLTTPDLEASILNDILFEHEVTTTADGRSIPLAIVFPADTMRAGARADFERLGPALAVLEDFIGVPWPTNRVYEWYGFRLGHSGGGGSLFMEDRGTYADRGVPQDVIVGHELGHSYIGHEQLNQFLEVYAYNLVETGSTELSTWGWTRPCGGMPYVPFAPENEGVWALMDIYQLIGPAGMGRAYARIHALGAPYGVPLAAAARQTFVDEAPAEAREQVADLVLRI